MTRSREAFTPPQIVKKVLAAAGDDLVLVGGQSLAFWLDNYGLADSESGSDAVTNDVDFLSATPTDTEAVERMAKAIVGKTQFPRRSALTALVGQAIRELSSEEHINVDVIFRVVGLEAASVRKRAIHVRSPDGSPDYFVMHPLDVLASRLANLYQLREKQDNKGRLQLALSVDVAREFLRREATKARAAEVAGGRSPIQNYVTSIEKLAKDDAGRKVATRWGVHVADAIDPHLIPAGPFWTKRWPSLQKLMSPAYQAGITEPQSKPATKARKKT